MYTKLKRNLPGLFIYCCWHKSKKESTRFI